MSLRTRFKLYVCVFFSLIACAAVVSFNSITFESPPLPPLKQVSESPEIAKYTEPGTAILEEQEDVIPELIMELLPAFEHFTNPPDVSLVEAKKEAQIEYLLAKYKRKETDIRQYVDLAYEHAQQYEVINPELILAVMQKESSLRPRARSSYGALGLMQVVPRFHREKLRRGESLFTPEVNVRVGAQVLKEYWVRSKGNWPTTLKKYSGNAKNYARDVLKEAEQLAALGDAASQAMLNEITLEQLFALR